MRVQMWRGNEGSITRTERSWFRHRAHWARLTVLTGLLVFSACGDDDGVDSPQPPIDSPEPPVDSPEPPVDSPEPPAYLIQNEIQGQDGRTVFVHVLPSLTAELDLSRTREFSGVSRARAAFGKVFVFEGESGEISRYAVTSEPALEFEDRFSLAPLGITVFNPSIVFISETRAYTFSADTRQVAVWNPERMEIIDSIDLDGELASPAFFGLTDMTLSSDGSVVFLPYVAFDFATNEAGLTEATVIVLSASESEVITVLSDPRCPPGRIGVVDPQSGDYIFVGDGFWGVVPNFAVNGPTPSSCLLRVPAGSTSFDPDWSIPGAALSPEGFVDIDYLRVVGDRFVALVRDDAPPTDVGTFLSESMWQPYVGSTADWVGEAATPAPGVTTFFGDVHIVDEEFILTPVNILDRASDAAAFIYRVDENDAIQDINEGVGSITWVERIR